MVLKKKEIIAASLVVLIGVAGYLNWSYRDTVNVRDGESYIETGKRLGEAQYVSSNEEVEENKENKEDEAEDKEKAEETAADAENKENTDTSEPPANGSAVAENYFEQAKIDKEASRAKALEILNKTAENNSFDEEIRKKAGDKILANADYVKKETEIEGIAQSKGYSEICVYVDDGGANVVVRKEGFKDEDALRLTDIVTDQLKISAQNVKIVEVK